MKSIPNQSYVLAAEYGREHSPSARLLIVAVMIALLFASFPVRGVLAAPASDGDPITIGDPELEWSNKQLNLRAMGYFYDHIQLYPADFEDRDQLALAHGILEKYAFALRQANTIVLNHKGFDTKGQVTNEIQAEQSLKDLAMYLHMLRGLRAKFEEQGFKYRIVR